MSAQNPKPRSDVLLIDDSDLLRRSLVRVLRAAGIETIDLPSPIGASSAILRNGIRVVIIDVDMPAMRGDKLVALLRRSKRLEHVKLVLMSGIDPDELRALAAEVEADAVLAKSEGPSAFVEKVGSLLGEVSPPG